MRNANQRKQGRGTNARKDILRETDQFLARRRLLSELVRDTCHSLAETETDWLVKAAPQLGYDEQYRYAYEGYAKMLLKDLMNALVKGFNGIEG